MPDQASWRNIAIALINLGVHFPDVKAGGRAESLEAFSTRREPRFLVTLRRGFFKRPVAFFFRCLAGRFKFLRRTLDAPQPHALIVCPCRVEIWLRVVEA
jgi:hypothetical protein